MTADRAACLRFAGTRWWKIIAIAFSRIEKAMALKNSSAAMPMPPIRSRCRRNAATCAVMAGAWPGTRNSRLIATVWISRSSSTRCDSATSRSANSGTSDSSV